MPKQPLDRLPKLARTTTTVVILDTSKADAYDSALMGVQSKEKELSASLPRRAAAARAGVSAGAPEEDVLAALDAVRQADEATMKPLRDALSAADTALDAVREKWTFKSLGNVKWKRMVHANPAGDEDQAEWEANGGQGKCPYAFEGIARALLKEATVTPAQTPEEIDEVFDGDAWSDAEINHLWTSALAAQITARPDPKGRRG